MPVTVHTCPSIAEAAAALQADRSAKFLAGGTLVMRALNEGDVSISSVIRATDATFTEIRAAGQRVTFGAGVTMAQIMGNHELAFLHPVARAVGGPAVRNMATVGGNLFAPSPYGDFTTALLALDATLAVQGGFSGRETTIEEFLTGRERSNDLVASISFSRPASPGAFRFRKMARVKPKGISVVAIAAHLPTSSGRIAGARVAYGAMAPTPVRAKAVERALEGRALDDAGIASALAVAAEGTNPPTDALASAWYRREMIGVQLGRLLRGEAA